MTIRDFERAGRLLADLAWVGNDKNFSVSWNILELRGHEERRKAWEAPRQNISKALQTLLQQEREQYQASILAELNALGVEAQPHRA